MNKRPAFVGLLVLFTLVLQGPAILQSQSPAFPVLIQLPSGFGPEGIAVGRGPTFYTGALVPPTSGQILVGDLMTGQVSELVAPTGRPALGMKYDPRSDLLFVAGGTSGRATVYAASSGDQIGFYQFRPPSSPPPAFPTTVINDVVVTRNAVYFTDSVTPVLYRVALGPGGEPAPGFEEIPLPGNFGLTGACPGTPARANGIDAAPNGKHLIVLHTSEGQLYRIDTATHAVDAIELGADSLCSGDGILLDGNTLYVVQNVMNRIAVVGLSPDHLSGRITDDITEPFASNPATKVPTTLAEFGNYLYAVTAGFAPPTPDVVVRLRK
jgi:sugar lactone lactonase YvrE